MTSNSTTRKKEDPEAIKLRMKVAGVLAEVGNGDKVSSIGVAFSDFTCAEKTATVYRKLRVAAFGDDMDVSAKLEPVSNTVFVTLSNGVKLPTPGFGTLNLTGNVCRQTLCRALELGYRHIDTADLHNNELDIGQVLSECTIPREEIFITSKFLGHGSKHVRMCFMASLRRLGLTYIDLFLMQWPGGGPRLERTRSWAALESLYSEGLCKAIGVSNFSARHLTELVSECTMHPHVNQIELHPHLPQHQLIAACSDFKVQVVGYKPFAGGILLEEETVIEIAQKYKVTPAQLLLRWQVQQGIVPLPRSQQVEHLRENLCVHDFVLADVDMGRLELMDLDKAYDWEPDGEP